MLLYTRDDNSSRRVHHALVVVTDFTCFGKFDHHEACLLEAVGHGFVFRFVPDTHHHLNGPQQFNLKLGAHAEDRQNPTKGSPPVTNLERLNDALVERLQLHC